MSKRFSLLPSVIFEDDFFIAFDKPAGLSVIPERGGTRESLVDLVHRHISPDYFNVHRLDRDTSGVLLFGKTKAVVRRFAELFRMQQIDKVYLAITGGIPQGSSFIIAKPIMPDRRHPGRMRIGGGRRCETRVEVLEHWSDRFAFVRLRPQTGRTHQIRLHLASIGCPVLADPLYGDGRMLFLSELKRNYKQKQESERPLMARLALHAEQLSFRHPVTSRQLTVTATLPKDFQLALKYLMRYGR